MDTLVRMLPFVLIIGVFWFFVIRPASRRQKALQEIQRQLDVGAYVITGGGIFGTIDFIDGDKVGLEIADGVVMTVSRQSIVGELPADDASGEASADADQDRTAVDHTADQDR